MNNLGIAQEINDEILAFFKKEISVPVGYSQEFKKEVQVDGSKAYLFRYEKERNKGNVREHFSFLVSGEKPYKILGLTHMDSGYEHTGYLSEPETEKIARNFLKKMDPELNQELVNLWIQPHDEEITAGNKKIKVKGMKYKCYHQKENDYTWVIVAGNRDIITFERDILWDNNRHERITEKWLHDSWVHEEEKNNIIKITERSFINVTLNYMNTDDMRKGFHPDFAIFIRNGNNINRLFLEQWIKVIEDYKSDAEKVKSGIRNVKATYDIIDLSGTAAMIKVKLYRENQLLTTDYLSLLKFDNGWKIVSKVSNEEVENPFKI